MGRSVNCIARLYLYNIEAITGCIQIIESKHDEYSLLKLSPEKSSTAIFSIHFSKCLSIDTREIEDPTLIREFLEQTPLFWTRNAKQIMMQIETIPVWKNALAHFILNTPVSYVNLVSDLVAFNQPDLLPLFFTLTNQDSTVLAQLATSNPSSFLDWIKFAYLGMHLTPQSIKISVF